MRCGVIGLGNIGYQSELDPIRVKPASHCSSYIAHPESELCAIFDQDSAKTELAFNNIKNARKCYNIDEIKEMSLDIISVATNLESHFDIVVSLAGSCKLILCEKPIAENYERAMRMVDLCDKKNTILLINYHRRFDPLIINCKNRIESDLGRINSVSSYYTNGILHNGSHMINLLLYFFGNFENIKSKYSFNSCLDGDFNADILFNAGNVSCSMQSLEVKHMNIFDVRFFCEKGIANLTQFSKRLEITKRRDCTLFSGYYEPNYDDREVIHNLGSSVYSSIDYAISSLKRGFDSCDSARGAAETIRIINNIDHELRKINEQ